MEMQEAIAYGKGREIGKAETIDEVLEMNAQTVTARAFYPSPLHVAMQLSIRHHPGLIDTLYHP